MKLSDFMAWYAKRSRGEQRVVDMLIAGVICLIIGAVVW